MGTWPGQWIHRQDRARQGLMQEHSGTRWGPLVNPAVLPSAVATSHVWLLQFQFQLIKIKFSVPRSH